MEKNGRGLIKIVREQNIAPFVLETKLARLK